LKPAWVQPLNLIKRDILVSKFAFAFNGLYRYAVDYDVKGDEKLVAVSYASLAKDVSPGSQILCADGQGWHVSPRYFCVATFHHVILRSKHGSIDDSRCDGPCDQSNTPRE
jgi:hypothetical protein